MMHNINSNIQPCEIMKPDYQAAYTALARRVAAADAYLVSANTEEAKREIEQAMIVVAQVEKLFSLISLPS